MAELEAAEAEADAAVTELDGTEADEAREKAATADGMVNKLRYEASFMLVCLACLSLLAVLLGWIAAINKYE